MSYIPTRDADVVTWGANYTTLITADPPRYGLLAGDALTLQNAFDLFSAAYTASQDPGTRNSVTVAAKDGQKALFLALARAYAAIIRANLGVTDPDKVALGLTIPDPTPTPVPQPTTVPVFQSVLIGSSYHTLTIADSLTPDKKAKPFGVLGGLIYRSIGTAPAVNFDAADPMLVADITKGTKVVDVPSGSTGKIATYWGQWFTRTGLFGPVGAPTSVVCP